MGDQRKRARKAQKGGDALQDAIVRFARQTDHATEFKGYERDDLYTVVENVETLEDGRVLLALRESPFYAEMGGQTADTGVVEGESGKVQVIDVQQQGEVQVLVARPLDGEIEAGVRVKAMLSSSHRHDVAANHTATHLLHYALRSRLGKDVTQAGSSVRADKFRFDFAYHEPIGKEHLKEIEELVNRRIVENHPVRTFTTSLEHARDLGAMALFGEKYGDFVRVVEIDDFSRELCGGTHVAGTSEIGAFKILSEGSVGANVRRIEAISGRAAVAYYRDRDLLASNAASALGVTEDQLLPGLARLQTRVATLESELAGFVSEAAKDVVAILASEAAKHDGVAVVAATVQARDMDHLLALVDQVQGTDPTQRGRSRCRSAGQSRAGGECQLQGERDKRRPGGQDCLSCVRRPRGRNAPTRSWRGGDPAKLAEAIEKARETVLAGLSG